MLPPPVTGLYARYLGAPGGSTTRYYWVQAIYFDGSRSNWAGPVQVNNTPAGLGGGATPDSLSGNFVAIQWNPAPGAVSYDVISTTSATYPSGQGNIGLAIGITQSSIADTTVGAYKAYTPINRSFLNVAVLRWDFAVDGGAIGTLTPATSDVIPTNATVIGGTVKVTAAAAAAAGGTLAIVAPAASGNLLAATGFATLAANAMVNVSATFAAPVRVTTGGQLQVTIAVGAFTAGSLEAFFFYVLPTE